MAELLEKMIAHGQFSASDRALIESEALESGIALMESEITVLKWLAEEYGLEFTDITDVIPERDVLSAFPANVLLKHELLPLRRDNNSVVVATSRLFHTEGFDMLKMLTGERLVPVLAPSEAIAKALKKYLGVGADTLHTMEEKSPFEVLKDEDEDNVDLDGVEEDASIIRFVNQVLADAIALRATDVHIEPFEDELRIRYRIDGVLQDVPTPTQIKRYQPAIVSRVKILSGLDIAEKRLPQDGRIKIRVEQREVDVRVSVIPMLYGEAVVLRLLRQDSALRGLNELLMSPRENRIMRSILELPHGIMLVTGPTGSGKTTTLYASLSEINTSERKIITIEDPIEYHLKGLNQIQVSTKTGLTFARGLRSILRHDPDVVLVGEIRDGETADIAVQASLTGHLVFSTLHTNDAPGAITRLVDMGVEPYLVASSLEAVLAQRLVRVICTSCRTEDTSAAAQSFKHEIGLVPSDPIYSSTGCEECRYTGYRGRQAVFELMAVTEEIRELILSTTSTGEIREMAKRQGMKTLREDGWRLVKDGKTTMEELLRVTKDVRLNGTVETNGERAV